MKKHLPLFSFILLLAIVFTACSSEPKTALPQAPVSAAPAIDTSGFARFQQWKAENELAAIEAYNQPQEQPVARPVAKAKKVYQAPARRSRAVAAAPKRKAASKNSTASSQQTGTANGGSGTVLNNEGADAAKAPEEKKGWSKAAKGTVIGAGGGAILGAVINKKNRAAGAVIGGVLGAGVGYGLGKVLDKKAADNK